MCWQNKSEFHADTNDRMMAHSKGIKGRVDSIQLWLYDDVKSLMGMSNVLPRCKICQRAIRNASMTDQTVKAGTQDLLYWLYVRPLNMRALYSVAFPVDTLALGKVARCVCMQRLFHTDFFNSEHV